MHVENCVNQNLKSHQLTGARYRLIRQFWLEIVKMMNGFIDILQSLKTALFMRGALVVHHGAMWTVMKIIILSWKYAKLAEDGDKNEME